jgi:uncharacterized RDD family membrane protein YckC
MDQRSKRLLATVITMMGLFVIAWALLLFAKAWVPSRSAPFAMTYVLLLVFGIGLTMAGVIARRRFGWLDRHFLEIKD